MIDRSRMVGGPLRARVGEVGSARKGLVTIVGYGRNTVGLGSALCASGMEVLAYDTYGEAEEGWCLRPDLALVGDHGGSGDPFDFLTWASDVWAREWEAGPILLFLLDRADRRLVDRALACGADDVVLRPHSVSAIQVRSNVVRGRRRESAGSLSQRVTLGKFTLDLRTRQVFDGEEPVSLSGREFELLIRLMEAGGEVVPRDDLLADIWGCDRQSEAVLEATVHRLRKRFCEQVREDELVATVRGIGYRLNPSLFEEGGRA